MTDADLNKLIALGERIVEQALRAGADVAEATVREGSHLSAKVRLGAPELVEEATSKSLGLRVMRGQQVAVTHTSDLSEQGLRLVVEDALELANLSQPDPFAGPPSPDQLSKRSEHVDLDLYDEAMGNLDAAQAIALAKRGEAAALAADSRITNSEGATVTRSAGGSALVTSAGFRGATRGTYASIQVVPVADDKDGKKRRGFHWSAKRHLAELADAVEVGEEAARRTVATLGARKVDTQEVPVIFDPDAGRSILGLLGGCMLGGAVWRRASYLADRAGERVASELVDVVDDPLILRAPGSRPFDGEGLIARVNHVVERGVLRGFLLDTYSARKLGKVTTGSASRGSSGGVSATTSNLVLRPGALTPESILASTPRGLYVTQMMGFGFNAVTGDFSRGASGFWIEDGKKTFPVSEVTISLNLDQLLQRINAVGNDLDLRTSTATPTFRVSAMTVAGR